MKWFKEHKKAASIGLFLLVLVLIGCGVAFSGPGNGSDQKEQKASVTDTKKETAEEKKSSDHGTCAEFWDTYILKIF